MTMRNLTALSCLCLLLATYCANGQNGVRIAAATGTAHASAMLDVVSTTKGVLIPRMTAAQRVAIATPATGLLVYQTDGTPAFYYYNGSAWIALSTGATVSGTTNYVSKFTAATALGNSQIQDDGTNVAIGIAPGTYKFNVNGSMNATTTIRAAGVMTNGGFDFILGNTDQTTRGNSGASRALVKDGGNVLTINYAGDFTGGTRIGSLAGTGTRPVYADANGTLSSNGRQYTANGTASGNLTTGTQTIITTGNFAVVTGELLKLNANIELRNVSGSGNDRWRIILQVSACGGAFTEISRTITATPYNNHGTYNYYPYVDMWVATCTGNVQFRFLGERFDSDDSWNHRNKRILITKE